MLKVHQEWGTFCSETRVQNDPFNKGLLKIIETKTFKSLSPPVL